MPHPRIFRKTLAEARSRNSSSMQRLREAFNQYPPDRQQRLVESAATDRDPGDCVKVSSYTVRAKLQEAWIKALLSFFKKNKKDPDLRVFLFTFSTFDGFTYEDKPVLAVDALRRKAWRLLKEQNLQGVCTFEIDVLSKRLAGEHSRRLILHVHGVCWTRDKAFEPGKVARDLSSKAQYRNPLGMPAVSFQSRRMARARKDPTIAPNAHLFDQPERDQTARSMAFLAYYMTKAATYAKNRWVDRDGKVRVDYDKGSFRLKTAIRMNEIISHFTPEQMVFSVGKEANQIRMAIRTTLRRRFGHIGAAGRKSASKHLAKAWSSYLKSNPKLGFNVSEVQHRTA